MAETQSREDTLTALLACTRALAAPTSVDEFLAGLIETACMQLGAHTGAFWRCDASQRSGAGAARA